MRSDFLKISAICGAVVAIVITAACGYILLPAIARALGFVTKSQANIDSANQDLPVAVTSYRDAGLPWFASEVDRIHPSESENAAPLLEQALSTIRQSSFSKIEQKFVSLELEGRYVEARALISRFDEPMALTTHAAKLPYLDYHHDWDFGPDVQFPEFSGIKILAKLLCFRARLNAAQGDFPSACRDITTTLKLARLAGQDQMLIAGLLKTALQEMACATCIDCAMFSKSNTGSLELLAETLRASWSKSDIVYWFPGEAYVGVALIRNLDQFGGLKGLSALSAGDTSDVAPLDPKRLKRTGLPADKLNRAFLDRHLRFWTAAAWLSVQDRDNPLKLGSDVDAIANHFLNEDDVSEVMNAVLIPDFSNATKRIVGIEAKYRATEALLEALAVDAKTGSMPKTISDIPGKWTDPFTGKALKVRASSKSITIYSLGPAMEDLGGGARGKAGDRTFNVSVSFPPTK